MNHDLNLEKEIIGAALVNEQALIELIDTIKKPDVFSDRDTKTAFKTIREIYLSSEPVDIIRVSKLAHKRTKWPEHECMPFLAGCMNQVSGTSFQKHNCLILLQLFIRRRIMEAGQKLINMSKDEGRDSLELLTEAMGEVDGIDRETEIEPAEDWSGVIDTMINTLHDQSKGKVVRGVKSGLKELDRVIGAFVPGQLITIAGRPGMGKSALAQHCLVHCSKSYGPALLITREMDAQDIAKRVFASETDLDMGIMFNNITTSQVEYARKTSEQIKRLPIHIDSKSSSLNQVIYSIRKHANQKGIKLAIVDYAQLVGGFDNKRYKGLTDTLTDVTRELKSLASTLGIPIIILSQLNREVEQRPRKVPQLSDLKQSGSIEEDSNVVILLYRPEYYDMLEFEDGSPAMGRVELIIPKNRNGKVGKVRAEYIGEKVKFQDAGEYPVDNDLPY